MSGGQVKILNSLSENGGEMLQSELVKESGLSRSRTSEIISLLEKRSIVSRFPLGKNYRVVLETEVRNRRKRHLRIGFIRSAEYPFIIPFRKHMREAFGIEIHLRIYENGLDVARDLSLSRLDLGIAPILVSFMFCSLGAPFQIVAPAGSGGSSVISSVRECSSHQPKVATTKLSTMELLMKASVHEHFLPDQSKIIYVSNPDDIIDGIVSKRYEAACVWEPYATLLTKKTGVSKIVSYADIEEHLCCVLSASNQLEDRTVSIITKKFADSIQEFSRDPYRFIDQYSRVVDFDKSILHEVSHEYTYPSELECTSIARQFEHSGIHTPNPLTIREMIRRAE